MKKNGARTLEADNKHEDQGDRYANRSATHF